MIQIRLCLSVFLYGMCLNGVAADELKPLTVSTFPNAKALPLWAGAQNGLFERRGLRVTIEETRGSKAQRERLASGKIDVAQAAVDNALAMIQAGQDVIIVMGGESGMNDFIVRPGVASFADMKERTLVVDAPDTAYALQARKLLAMSGLKSGIDYQVKSVGNARLRLQAMEKNPEDAGAILNPPFSTEAQLKGMKSLGRLVDLLGPYQAGGAFVLRKWAQTHPNRMEDYIEAYIDSLHWILDPAHKARAIGLLQEKLKLSPEVASAAYAQLIDPSFGFATNAKLDLAGFKNMLAIRAETEGPNARLSDMGAYIDESYYRRALSNMNLK